MEACLLSRGHQLSCTRLDLGEALPDLREVDWLIVMGGPMGVYDEEQYPWLKEEKAFIKGALGAGRLVLGICLGAQLMADVLGARVEKNVFREIGWFPINPSADIAGTFLEDLFPPGLEVFHWHGDTFDIPRGSQPLASSAACRNQGFMMGDRVIGLQFHLEVTPASAAELISNCRGELDGSRFVQQEAELMSDQVRFAHINDLICSLLLRLEERDPGPV